ncbi:MAG TPA: putative folate metabolism gamma-glutamate ligase, partial [Verrucomicrobiae bacterium]|nr:putative folate metabolism gamma-glutamate ligase [Verrucomicrobiae bacterium]
MLVTAIKTPKITAGSIDLVNLLDQALPVLTDGSIVVITSKIVSLCENSVIPIGSIDKEQLIAEQAELYLPPSFSRYNHHFTIIGNTLVGVAGIDESNGDGNYILWPRDAQ